jgi:hypothetical protein
LDGVDQILFLFLRPIYFADSGIDPAVPPLGALRPSPTTPDRRGHERPVVSAMGLDCGGEACVFFFAPSEGFAAELGARKQHRRQLRIHNRCELAKWGGMANEDFHTCGSFLEGNTMHCKCLHNLSNRTSFGSIFGDDWFRGCGNGLFGE